MIVEAPESDKFDFWLTHSEICDNGISLFKIPKIVSVSKILGIYSHPTNIHRRRLLESSFFMSTGRDLVCLVYDTQRTDVKIIPVHDTTKIALLERVEYTRVSGSYKSVADNGVKVILYKCEV